MQAQMQALVLVLVLAKTFFTFNKSQLVKGTTTHLKCVKAMIAKPSKEHCHYENEKGVKEIEREKKGTGNSTLVFGAVEHKIDKSRNKKSTIRCSLAKLVGDAGFEPATHWSQTSCATGLR